VNRLTRFAVLSAVSAALLAGPAFVQPASAQDDHHDQAQAQHDNHTYVKHSEWKKGYHMKAEDWSRGDRVDDWQAHKLRKPPSGYEWRQIDGNYVLGSINTGVVSMTIVAR
jgi:Ni/Co efflux regulator RcnB